MSTQLDQAICGAAALGDEGKLRSLLCCEGVTVNCRRCVNRLIISPLYVACAYGHENIVRLLLQHGANPDVCCDEDTSPLETAIVHGHAGIVALLLQHGVYTGRQKHKCGSETSALLVACALQQLDIAAMLLDYGADINSMDRLLLEASVGDPQTPIKDLNYTPLCMACEKGDLQMVQLLLTRGSEVNTALMMNPLVVAVHFQHLEIVQALLEAGAEAQLALFVALENNRMDIADILVKNGANVNQQVHKRLLLTEVCHRGLADWCHFLLAAGADPNLSDENGDTPLRLASRHGYPKIVQELLKFGVNVSVEEARESLFHAQRNGHRDIVFLLLRESPQAWPQLARVFNVK